jgi:hypothetical protein
MTRQAESTDTNPNMNVNSVSYIAILARRSSACQTSQGRGDGEH